MNSIFKTTIKNFLFDAEEGISVIFEKKDGTLRKMKCSLNPKLLPPFEEKEATKSDKPKNEDLFVVFDLESKAWRSFNFDSIKEIIL